MSETAPAKRRAVALVIVPVLVAGFPAYLLAGFMAYFMNDLPGSDDHVRFVTVMCVGAGVASVAATLAIRLLRRWDWWRAAAYATGGSIAVNGGFLAFGFGTAAPDLGADAAYTYGAWTTGQIYALAAGCAAAALAGLVMAIAASRAPDA